jgi:hypothetical protein
MANMLRPSASYEQEDARAYGYKSFEPDEIERRNGLFRSSQGDPRMTNEQRLDQRYGNYQYGPTPEYAQQQAEKMQSQGQFAQTTLGGMGQEAWTTGANIQGRATPGTDFGQADRQLQRVGDVGTDQARLHDRLINYGNQGPGDSIAQAQHERNTNAALRQQMMMAGSGRGAGGAANQFRQAGMNQAQIQGDANAANAIAQAEEADMWRGRQLQAYGMGGEVLAQQGALGMQQAGQMGSQAQFLTQAEMEAQAQRDNAGLQYQQLGMQGAQQGFGTQLTYEQMAMANLDAESQANRAYEENLTNLAIGKMNNRSQDQGGGMLDTVLGVASVAAPLVAAFSDERGKKNIRDDDSLSNTYRALGGSNGPANADDFTDEGWMQTGPEGWKANGAAWMAQREAEKRDQEQRDRWDRLKRERDEAQAAKDQKRMDLGNTIGNALSGLRNIL